MHETRIETIVDVPWGTDRAQLPLSLVPFPEHSESDVAGAGQSPEFPAWRVYEDGRVAVLNYFGGRYLPAETLQWLLVTSGAPGMAGTTRTAGHPFADPGAILAVDFFVREDGSLFLLERAARGDGGTISRLAAMSREGALLWKKDALDVAYVRIVPDDRGRLFLLAHEDGNQLHRVEPDTGNIAERYSAAPGTRLAIEANQGTRITAERLDRPDEARIQPPRDAPQALVYIFGIDARGDYYARLDEHILTIDFAGTILRKLALADYSELSGPSPVQADPIPRLSPLPSWHVDPMGRIYLSRVDAKGFSVLRITPG
jgi:hypothetical protein